MQTTVLERYVCVSMCVSVPHHRPETARACPGLAVYRLAQLSQDTRFSPRHLYWSMPPLPLVPQPFEPMALSSVDTLSPGFSSGAPPALPPPQPFGGGELRDLEEGCIATGPHAAGCHVGPTYLGRRSNCIAEAKIPQQVICT